MAAKYQVNLSVNAGTSFAQEFSITNADLSPKNITGYSLTGKIAKHPHAIDATLHSSKKKAYKTLDFNCRVVSGEGGIAEIYLPSKLTSQLKEGKYVYNVVSRTPNGELQEVVGGLVFVERAFASPDLEVIYDGGGANDGGGGDELIIDGGSAMGF